jgi:hypothetical protein
MPAAVFLFAGIGVPGCSAVGVLADYLLRQLSSQ